MLVTAAGVACWQRYQAGLPHARAEALVRAVQRGDPVAVQDLLRAGADPNATLSGGGYVAPSLPSSSQRGRATSETALISAAGRGSSDIVEALLRAGARVDERDPRAPKGPTPLIRAIDRKRTEVVHVLLDHGADPNLRGRISVSMADVVSPLLLAVERRHERMVAALLAAGAKPDPKDDLRRLAETHGPPSIVRLLREAGASTPSSAVHR